MKCLCCGASFEPTEEEEIKLRELNDGCSNIPFCSKECFQVVYEDRMSVKTGRDRLFWHDGDRTVPTYGGGTEIVVRPMTDEERASIEHYRGRETFSYGAAICVLPSSKFYGKCRSPVNWDN